MRLLIFNRKRLANTEPRWYFVGSARPSVLWNSGKSNILQFQKDEHGDRG